MKTAKITVSGNIAMYGCIEVCLEK